MHPTFSPAEFREAQRKLGLADAQLAAMLGVDPVHVRRFKVAIDKKSHRPVKPGTARLLSAYLAGYRPPDWPA